MGFPKGQLRQRFIGLDGARLPLTPIEVSILRILLERAAANPGDVVGDLSAGQFNRSPSPHAIGAIARGLLNWLLTGEIHDLPTIDDWRVKHGMIASMPPDDGIARRLRASKPAREDDAAIWRASSAPVAAEGDPWAEEAERRLAARAGGR
jgi:hypothetical protein